MKFFYTLFVLVILTNCATTKVTQQLKQRTDTDWVSSDVRFNQAKILWNRGFGAALGFETFRDYLDTIPKVPRFSSENEPRFPLLVLVDSRVNSMFASSLLGLCYSSILWKPDNLPNIYKNMGEGSFNADPYPDINDPKVYWIRANDGRKNQGILPSDAVHGFATDEIPLTSREGLALYAQYPEVVTDYHMYLPGSKHFCRGKDHVIMLGEWEGRLSLNHTPEVEGPLMTFGTPSRAK